MRLIAKEKLHIIIVIIALIACFLEKYFLFWEKERKNPSCTMYSTMNGWVSRELQAPFSFCVLQCSISIAFPALFNAITEIRIQYVHVNRWEPVYTITSRIIQWQLLGRWVEGIFFVLRGPNPSFIRGQTNMCMVFTYVKSHKPNEPYVLVPKLDHASKPHFQHSTQSLKCTPTVYLCMQ